jgi:HD-GYP domain-containing protein (c-di-GMP phosphodiesterase class II)
MRSSTSRGGSRPPSSRRCVCTRTTASGSCRGRAAFADVVEPAASHHERLDGKGYHRGLGRRDLSLLTRCLTVADVFEALIADRPYRGPMEVPDAMSILRAGAAFDPVCVSALEASLDRLAEPEPAMSETPVLGLH